MSSETLGFRRMSPAPGSRLVIVGGCGGIGRALVAACLDLDIRTAVLDLPSALVERPLPPEVLTAAVDASNEDEVAGGFEVIDRMWGGVDALVFVTGIAVIPPQPVESLDLSKWDRILDVNLRSAFLCSRAAIPRLRPHGGAIVTLSSSLAFNPNRGFGAYVASKGGLVSLTKAIAAENGPGIRANVVAPSAVDTPFLGGRPSGDEGSDAWFKANLDAYVAGIPMGRIAEPDDIVGPILFLAGPAARYITGQTLHVNGGRITP